MALAGAVWESSQIALTLKVAREELNKAIALMKHMRWTA